ncbi:MAG: hypothetical protein GY810_25795 [Aureispira sp.]|nr:hypothetical protein [Aureispira sp.]
MYRKTALPLILISVLLLFLFTGCDQASKDLFNASIEYGKIKFIIYFATFCYFIFMLTITSINFDNYLPTTSTEILIVKNNIKHKVYFTLVVTAGASLPLFYWGYWHIYQWPQDSIYPYYHDHKLLLMMLLLSCFFFLCGIITLIIKFNIFSLNLEIAQERLNKLTDQDSTKLN